MAPATETASVNVGFHPSFSRHGITRASSVLLIWLNENVPTPSATQGGMTGGSASNQRNSHREDTQSYASVQKT